MAEQRTAHLLDRTGVTAVTFVQDTPGGAWHTTQPFHWHPDGLLLLDGLVIRGPDEPRRIDLQLAAWPQLDL